MSVSFWTKTWGKDYPQMLSTGYEKKWQSIGYEFDVLGIAINNKVPEGIADGFLGRADIILDVPKMEQAVLDYFYLKEEDFKGGMVYSIAELACIRACDTDYLCYVQGDCLTMGMLGGKPGGSGDWVTEGIEILEENPEIMVVSPASDVNTWHTEFGLDQEFSDQAWLVRTKDFQNDAIYKVPGTDPNYPEYGGNSFEHMVGKYLKESGHFRKILKNFYAIHPAY